MAKINDYIIISYHINKGDITKFCACAIEKHADLTIEDVRKQISALSIPKGAELHIDKVQKLSNPKEIAKDQIPLISDIQNIFGIIVQQIEVIKRSKPSDE